MKLHILGSGTFVPRERRGSSGYLLLLGTSKVLLDCGAGTTWKLERAGASCVDIDHVFLTHFHPDHTSDLIPFLFAVKYAQRDSDPKPLRVWGPKGIRKLFEGFGNAYGGWITPEWLSVGQIGEGALEFDDFTLVAMRTPHTETSLAYRVESGGKSMVYTGDTDYSEEGAELAEETDLLLIECSTPEGEKMEGHLTPIEVADIVEKSRPKRVVLTHIYPSADEADIIGPIKKRVKANVVKAEDMMVIEI